MSNSYSLLRISNSLKMDKISISQIFHSRKLRRKNNNNVKTKEKIGTVPEVLVSQ